MRARVLMTADAAGGMWTYATELVRALSPRGVGFTVACMGPEPTAAQRAEMLDAGCAGLEYGGFRLEWMQDAWADVDRAADWLLSLAMECGADLVHLNGYCHAHLPFGRPVIVTGHSCVLSWWEAVCGSGAPCQWDEYRRRVQRGLLAADAVVAPTRWMLSELGRHYGEPEYGLTIPGGRTGPRLAVRPKEPLIFAAGRVWDEAGNIGLLAGVSERLRWPCIVAGEEGGNADAAGALIVAGRLESRAMWYHLGRASIFVHPARYEPFGLAPLEAALSGCALVLGDIPSLREVWGDAAVYVDPDDAPGLLAAANGLIEDDSRRAALAQAAREAARLYAPERCASAYASLYGELAHARTIRAGPLADLRAGAA
ncbi:MAG: glycosyltransferase family 4 protein [Phycisphaerales bacterium]